MSNTNTNTNKYLIPQLKKRHVPLINLGDDLKINNDGLDFNEAIVKINNLTMNNNPIHDLGKGIYNNDSINVQQFNEELVKIQTKINYLFEENASKTYIITQLQTRISNLEQYNEYLYNLFFKKSPQELIF